MYTLCVSYLEREDTNFVGKCGCIDKEGVATCSPEKKGEIMIFSAEDKRCANRFFDEN